MELSRRAAVSFLAMSAAMAAAPCGAIAQEVPMRDPAVNRQLPATSGAGAAEDAEMNTMRERLRVLSEKAHSNERRKRMLADGVKLLALSTELKGGVASAGTGGLGSEWLLKAEEIEKLARDVQQRMKN